ncbi:MAG TPA: SDR family oxidoreductase [Polyangia bacterium]
MLRVLVAGATGYLGRHVVAELARRGHFVRALARDGERLRRAAPQATEAFVGQITDPATLAHACDGVDAVFSSVGITRQRDRLTFRDVDYQGNVNLLEVALAARVPRLVYVSIVNADALGDLAIVRAHEEFVARLRASAIDGTVLRPTGYFSDMTEFLTMARGGRAYLFGDGSARMNPIAGADLAVTAADAIERGGSEIAVGGPETLTIRQIAETAFAAVGKPARIRSLPVGLVRGATSLVRLFSRRTADLLAFQTAVLTRDMVAPPTGTLTLGEHFRRELAAQPAL